MATEAVVSHHTSAADEVEKKENEEVTANGQKSVSLSNANEEKHDKVEDTTLSEAKTETEDKVEVEKIDAFKEKEAITDSQTIIVTGHTAPEKESADTEEEENIPHAPAEETIEESSKIKSPELNPPIESKLVKETPEPEGAETQEISRVTGKESPEREPREQPNTVAVPEEAIEKQSESFQEMPREPEPGVEVLKPETEVAQMQEISQEQEQESLQKEQEEQENTAVVVPEASEETIKAVSEAFEEKQEPDAEVVKETETLETGSQDVEKPEPVEGNPKTEPEAEGVKETEDSENSSDKLEKPEPVVAQVQEKSQEATEEKGEDERENTAAVVLEGSAETTKKVNEAVEEEEKPDAEVVKESEISETVFQIVERPEPIEGNPKTESETEGVKETEISETSSDKVEEPESVVAQEQEKSKDSEKENKVGEVTEGSTETIEKVIDEEKPGEVAKETDEPEPAVTKIENPSEPEVKFVENEATEKSLDIIEDHFTRESDIQVVKETDKTDALPVEAEKPQVESEKPGEQSQVAQVEVEEKSKDVETKQEVVRENQSAKSEETSDTQVPTSGESQKEEEETTVTNNAEAQVAAVEEDHKKESSHSDVVQDLAKDVVDVSATTEQGTNKKESNVEEKVPANDGKEPSREAVVETDEAKTGTTAVDSVKHEDGHQESKVEEVIAVVSESVRGTLASKLQEKEESKLETQHVEDNVNTQEPSTKENDTIKTSKDLPKEISAKPAQKHSNNIISKVKQSLVKAKKAIIGKSPSSKTLSSNNTQGDIKVK
ncbi:hypothetical protein L6164_010402 [Bauhinia variegata]|uniref:Uncharacterized protein n=1 Tax=Bauhinia variegata TaxID=167791 RepID=A0ACB9PPD6_BAUVA|nr:hypothetical protein L6164_010402 [Bauhinia variegata]